MRVRMSTTLYSCEIFSLLRDAKFRLLENLVGTGPGIFSLWIVP